MRRAVFRSAAACAGMLVAAAAGVVSAQPMPSDPTNGADEPIELPTPAPSTPVPRPKPKSEPAPVPSAALPDPGVTADRVVAHAGPIVGVHAGFGRLSGPAGADNSWAPWVDVEAGAWIASRTAVVAFAGSSIKSDAGFDGHLEQVSFGARASYVVAPRFWIGVGGAYLGQRFTLTSQSGVEERIDHWSPALELRAGYQIGHVGHVAFDGIFQGIAFELDAREVKGAASLANFALGAEWR